MCSDRFCWTHFISWSSLTPRLEYFLVRFLQKHTQTCERGFLHIWQTHTHTRRTWAVWHNSVRCQLSLWQTSRNAPAVPVHTECDVQSHRADPKHKHTQQINTVCLYNLSSECDDNSLICTSKEKSSISWCFIHILNTFSLSEGHIKWSCRHSGCVSWF